MTLTDYNGNIAFQFVDSECSECLESYQETKSKADWIQSIKCNRWFIELILATRSVVILGEWKSKSKNEKNGQK